MDLKNVQMLENHSMNKRLRNKLFSLDLAFLGCVIEHLEDSILLKRALGAAKTEVHRDVVARMMLKYPEALVWKYFDYRESLLKEYVEKIKQIRRAKKQHLCRLQTLRKRNRK